MTTPQTTDIMIRNDSGEVADIVLSHRYFVAVAAAEWQQWKSVAPGATVGPLTVHFETGLGSGTDRWFVQITLGASGRRRIYKSYGSKLKPGKFCTLMDGDQGGQHVLSVAVDRFDVNLRSGGCRAGMTYAGTVTNEITNVFVLMLENRSFDHIFGWWDPGPGGNPVDGLKPTMNNIVDGVPVVVRQAPADTPTSAGPGHEFADAYFQLTGTVAPQQLAGDYPKGDCSGFAASYKQALANWKHPGPQPTDDAHLGEVMSGVAPGRNLVLHQLARDFAVCDRWFSSMPGPTWPNRFFALAGSSAGLDDSPVSRNNVLAISVAPYQFPNGTIFSALEAAGCGRRIYMDRSNLFAGPNKAGTFSLGNVPIASGMANVSKLTVSDFGNFAADLQDTYTEQFTFIEPHYGDAYHDTYVGGSSQHPIDTLYAGEQLIAATYQAIRNSPMWETSLLIVTYDEHGGFYDHVPPPPATPPRDVPIGGGYSVHNFGFDRLGARVPAVVISPRIPAHTVSSTVYDHTSIIRTVLKLFVGDDAHLTERDRAAADLLGLLSGPARAATSTSYTSGAPTPPSTIPVDPSHGTEPIPQSGNTVGVLQRLAQIDAALTDGSDVALAAVLARVNRLRTMADAEAYATDVLSREQTAEADAALADACLGGLADPSQLANLAAASLVGIPAPELNGYLAEALARGLAGRIRDLRLSYDEAQVAMAALEKAVTSGRLLTDIDGTPLVVTAALPASVRSRLMLAAPSRPGSTAFATRAPIPVPPTAPPAPDVIAAPPSAPAPPAAPTAAGPGTADGRGPTTGAADRQGWIRSAIERVVAAIRGAIRKVTSRRHR